MPDFPKILTYDIETGAGVNGFKSNLSVALCIGYKWAHEKKAKILSVLDYGDPRKKLVTDWDTPMLEEFAKVLGEADVIVGHYATRFDFKYLTGRIVLKGLPPFPPVTHHDTWAMSKRLMAMDSNSLKNLSKNLKLGNQKLDNGWPNWWIEVGRNPHKYVKEMLPYCVGDVMATEELYFKLLPYIRDRGRAHLFSDRPVCTACGAASLTKRGRYVTTTKITQRYQCQSCGHWEQGKL
jgi:DNA polymerase elongation subunit (family B)